MKVMALIGGMSWNSTLEYYRLINELVSVRLGFLHSAQIALYSLNFAEVERVQREARWVEATDILVGAGTALKQAGADFMVICTNTMHKVAERVGLPILHITDVTGSAISEHSLRRVGLLGTRFGMEEAFYQERLRISFGLEVLVPKQTEQDVVHRIIYEELCLGKIRRASRQACSRLSKG